MSKPNKQASKTTNKNPYFLIYGVRKIRFSYVEDRYYAKSPQTDKSEII